MKKVNIEFISQFKSSVKISFLKKFYCAKIEIFSFFISSTVSISFEFSYHFLCYHKNTAMTIKPQAYRNCRN